MSGLPNGVTKGVFVTLSLLSCILAATGLISCGMVVNDPEDINGTGEIEIVYEVSGSVAAADIVIRGNDASVTVGTEGEDGSVSPETVTLPWTSEAYSYSGMSHVYFSIAASNAKREEKTSGTLTTYAEDHLIDGTASFTTEVAAGDYVYNSADDIFAEITAVNSATDCSLNRVLFAESWRTYYIYQKGTTLVSGTTTSVNTDQLIDSTANFLGKVIDNDEVANNTTGDTTKVDGDAAGDGTTLDLDTHIFTAADQYYLISRDENPVAGNPTTISTNHLIDSGADFETAGVAAGFLAARMSGGIPVAFAQVVSVSVNDLTLDNHIFTSTGDDYKIYMVKSSPAFSTTQQSNKLFDSSASFLSGVKKDDVVYNPEKNLYGTVSSVDSNTELSLNADVFPAVSIDYSVYAPRTLTVTVYVNGTVYDTFTSEHWDILEAALSGAIDTAAVAAGTE